MALIKSVQGFTPKIAKDVYLAENATIIGEVEIGEGSSVWFNAVLRGDVGGIRLGKNVNIQDGCMLHATYGKSTVEVGDNVSVGHNAIVHGAKICNNVLIGMGAVVMDNVVVGENSIIAAGAVVTKNTNIEPGSLYAGIPAKKIKDVTPEQAESVITRTAESYRKYSAWHDESTPNESENK